MAKDPVRISDHAVLRYMERAMGLNVELVRQHIAAICAGPAGIGASCVRSEGIRFELVNNAVTTCVPDRQNPSLTGLARNQQAIRRRKENGNELGS